MTSEAPSLFGSKTVEIGDVTYTVTELDGGIYDKCIELARNETGIDMAALLKFMAERSVTPKMTIAEINALPMTKRAELFDAVNEVHYPVRPKATSD